MIVKTQQITKQTGFEIHEFGGEMSLAEIQAALLEPLARALARSIREGLDKGRLAIDHDQVVCGTIEPDYLILPEDVTDEV